MNQPMQNQSITLSIKPLLVLIALMLCFATGSAWAVCQDTCLTNNNTVQGDDALINLTTGLSNTAIGFNALFDNTTGNSNTAVGSEALASTTVSNSTAVGNRALTNNTTGINTAVGSGALSNSTTGNNNTAVGKDALLVSTTAGNNTATGASALKNTTTGGFNTAVGTSALATNTTGLGNTAVGYFALNKISTVSDSTAVGRLALRNSTGANNTAVGSSALISNTTGTNNIAIGASALPGNTTGSSNIVLGTSAGPLLTTGSNNISIANNSGGVLGESATIRIGTSGTHTNTYIAGISGVTVAGGVGVIIDNNGHLGTVVSSARFKDQIEPMDKASEAILALKPVTFRYKSDLDPDAIPQFGLVAEEVEKVHPHLVARDKKGVPYTVRYEAVNAMLLNEFLKQHRTVQEQQATIAELRKDMAAVTARLKEHEAQIQKVGARLEANRAVPQMADNR
jgi:hypothetical protein